MRIEAPFVLPADIILSSVADLPAASLAQLEYREGDYILTRPRSRTPSMIVDAQTGGLLELFREPATLVDAVIRYSAAAGLDPSETLEHAFPALQRILNAELLVTAGSALEKQIESSHSFGDSVGSFRIIEPITVVVDTEVYLARAADETLVALKLARPGAERRLATRLEREAAILERLDGSMVPRLVARGIAGERPFVALSWCAGVDAYVASMEARRRGHAGLADLLLIVERITVAYAHLHEQGVVHGDVHPGNVIVDRNNRVTLIDFGVASPIISQGSAEIAPERGVIDLYMEPELAKARRGSRPSPPASHAGEQYALAALLYFLLTGAHTHNFVLEEDEMLRQVIEDSPLAFAEHGASGFMSLESVLVRALSKDPADRFPSVAEFARCISVAVSADQAVESPGRPPAPARSNAHIFLDKMIDGLSKPGWFQGRRLQAPTASFHNGAAGIAYTLLRIARTRDDDRLLAVADLWSNRAVQDVLSSSPDALYSESLELNRQTIGVSSLYHAASGVYCIDALVAHSRGDDIALGRAIAAFIATSDISSSQADVSQGWAGSLLGCSFLLDVQPSSLGPEGQSLRRLGDDLLARIWRELIHSPAILEARTQTMLGAAHGWAGQLYAMLRWCEASGADVPDGVDRRLNELAALATPIGSGLRWPAAIGRHRHESALWASWCNGAAGFVHLWTFAARHFGGEQYPDLATGAAWAVYQAPFGTADLCCGLAGRAYALLNIYKYTGDRTWVERARELADHAAVRVRAGLTLRDSLYKGDIGIGLLVSDLADPEHACMPLYEKEGWKSQLTLRSS